MIRSPEQSVGKDMELRESLNGLGILVVLLDFDDTLISTRSIFVRQMQLYCREVALNLGLDYEEFKLELETTNNEFFRTHGVNPKRWQHINEALISKRGENKRGVFDNAISYLQDIYRITPEFKPGALEILEVFKKTGIQIGLVTHANQDWTDFKLDQLGIRHFFDLVEVVDENSHKSSEHWKKAITNFGVRPTEVLIVGDNLKGDILSGVEAGASKVVWVDEGEGWSLYRQGQLPESAYSISGINKLPELLIEEYKKMKVSRRYS